MVRIMKNRECARGSSGVLDEEADLPRGALIVGRYQQSTLRRVRRRPLEFPDKPVVCLDP